MKYTVSLTGYDALDFFLLLNLGSFDLLEKKFS